VHHFTIKCVLYGTIAAKLTGVRSVVNAVTGLGHIFLGQRAITRAVRPLVRWLYRRILKARRGLVVFQNPDDLDTFVQANLVDPEKTVIIRSSGVCLQKFAPRPSDPDLPASSVPVVLFAGRLLEEKGIHEFVQAARIVKQTRDVCFQMAGERDAGNPSSASKETVEAWRLEGVVDMLGHIEAMDDIIALADIVVLPSYREGTPRVLLEAGAMGKPIVATDVPGCREVVKDGYNGILVPVKDSEALARAVESLLADQEESRRMGLNGRLLIEKEFGSDKVVQSTLQVYNTLGVVG
jgi:glycosyltransferase involved in cell wall biosynthesis